MRRVTIQALIGTQFCGKPTGAGRDGKHVCLRRPGHTGICTPVWQQRKLTREERLERQLAVARAERSRARAHARNLAKIIHRLERRRAYLESFPSVRIERRIRGGYRRLRRYYRFVRNRTWGRKRRG